MADIQQEPKEPIQQTPVQQPTAQDAQLNSLLTLNHVIYGLYILGCITFVTSIVGIIIAYIKRPEAQGTWLESHFRWQIYTFWYGCIWLIAGFILSIIIIGNLILFAGLIWWLYRVVKGWLYLNDKRPMPY